MITIDPDVLWTGIGLLIAAIAFGIREYFKTRHEAQNAQSYADKKRADGALVIEEAQAGVLNDISTIARSGVEAQKAILDVVRENTAAFNKYASVASDTTSELKGLKDTISSNTSALNAVTAGMGETGEAIDEIKAAVVKIDHAAAALETNLGITFKDTFSAQFGPVVDSIMSIDTQLKALAVDLASSDTRLAQHFSEIAKDFQEAKRQFISLLEPIVLKHAAEFMPHDASPSNNGKEQSS